MWKEGVGQTRRHRKSMLVGTAHTLTCVGEGKSQSSSSVGDQCTESFDPMSHFYSVKYQE
jgi:hypothetical protein